MPVQRVNCNRQATAVHRGSTQLRKAADKRTDRRGGGTGMEAVHPLERGLVMDGVQECQTPSKRLRVILTVPKWQKQMAQIEVGSHCYELPDTVASLGVLGNLADRVDGQLATGVNACGGSHLLVETHQTLPAKKKPRLSQY